MKKSITHTIAIASLLLASSSSALAAPIVESVLFNNQHKLQINLTTTIEHQINQQLNTANKLMSEKIEQRLARQIEL
ncbi:hypothetical protein [Psychrobium sp. 1_MG-2023]|uniref:hypothetical protein n=1 Tax=Psychrobium sp. 1_MG-2023 TaxID=3062624 RepID=UPI000C32C805|nr:hypothetical protein [Psychrobium sp. 1_MG-2023]MDP2561316.1 hypothetical protein [Psychrobium sp. 1_MG-2023]PKF54131.1 hypothetical protein CW748_16875 [Alteromonadales bacterium alter-6D02]